MTILVTFIFAVSFLMIGSFLRSEDFLPKIKTFYRSHFLRSKSATFNLFSIGPLNFSSRTLFIKIFYRAPTSNKINPKPKPLKNPHPRPTKKYSITIYIHSLKKVTEFIKEWWFLLYILEMGEI